MSSTHPEQNSTPDEPTPIDWRRFVASATTVSLLTLAAKGLGFLEKLILAHFGGTSSQTDAYFTVYSVAFFLYVLIEEIVAPVFLVRYVQIRESNSPRSAIRFARQVMFVVFAALLVVAVSIELAPELLLRVIAPGFNLEQMSWAKSLLTYAAPAGLLMGLAALTYVLLNAHKSFAWPALGGTIFKVGIVLGMMVLIPRLGMVGAVVSILVAAGLQLAQHIGGLVWWIPSRSPQMPIHETRLHEDRAGQLGPLVRLMAPLAVGTFAAQACTFVDNACASTLSPGAIAALGYAHRLIDLPILLVPSVLGIVAFPVLAQLAAQHDTRAVMNLMAQLMGFCLIVFLPAFIVFYSDAPTIVRAVFGRGRFDENAVIVTATALATFAFGLPAFAVEIPLLRTYYALQDTKTPTVVGLILVFLHVVLTILLTPRIGVMAVPLALATRKTLKVVILVWLLNQRTPDPWRLRLVHGAARIALCALAFWALLIAARRGLGRLPGAPSKNSLALLLGSVAIASLGYAISLTAAGLIRPRHLAWLRGRFQRTTAEDRKIG